MKTNEKLVTISVFICLHVLVLFVIRAIHLYRTMNWFLDLWVMGVYRSSQNPWYPCSMFNNPIDNLECSAISQMLGWLVWLAWGLYSGFDVVSCCGDGDAAAGIVAAALLPEATTLGMLAMSRRESQLLGRPTSCRGKAMTKYLATQ